LVNITAGRLADGICSHAKKDRTMSSSTARWNERLHPATNSTSRPNTQAKTGHDDKKQRVKLHITYHCLFSRLSHLFYMDGRSFSLSLFNHPGFLVLLPLSLPLPSTTPRPIYLSSQGGVDLILFSVVSFFHSSIVVVQLHCAAVSSISHLIMSSREAQAATGSQGV